MRNPSLDVLRGVAVILVFCYHAEGALLVSRFGWTGVDLFFVLSGFLVSGLLFREYQATQQIRPGRFLMRRGLKIYPQFYFFIAMMFAAAYGLGTTPHAGQVFAELAFVQNYAPGMWTHTWSLGVEEHFYLLLSLGVVVLARRRGPDPFRALPVWIAAACAAVLGLRVLTWVLHPAITDRLNIFPTHLRVDSLLTGVLISYFHAFRPQELAGWMRRVGPWVPPASIVLLSPVTFLTREDPFMVTVGFSLVSWGFGLLLLSLLYPVKPAPAISRGARAMAGLGRVSYAFYLWHGPILAAADAFKLYGQRHGVPLSMPVMFVLSFAVSLLAAVATTKLIEIPVLRARDRWMPEQRATANRLPMVADLVPSTTGTS